MLKELYDYAQKNALTAKPGFKERKVDGYISLNKTGEFLGIVPSVSKKVLVPDLGSTANGSMKCNILISKAEYIFSLGNGNIPMKHVFFKDALRFGGKYEPMFQTCLDALESPDCFEKMKTAFEESRFKPASMLGFQVDGFAIEQSGRYLEWWQKFRKEQCGISDKAGNHVCLVTGELIVPAATVPKVSGLRVVGGHSSGDAIICFDKAAFCSNDLKQGENAAVSEEAITAVNAALGKLIQEAPTHANTKLVHWYHQKEEIDYFRLTDFDFYWGSENETAASNKEDEEEAINQQEIRNLAKAIWNGELPAQPENRYYMLPMSGGGGRIMIRGFDEGNCGELHENFAAWFHDLSLCTVGKVGTKKHPKLYTIYMRLLKQGGGGKSISDRMKKELSGLDTYVLYSIVKKRPLPDSMAVRALAYIRSALYNDNDSGYMKHPDDVCCQILKAWLIRRGKPMSVTVNFDYPSAAYQCGRLFAVYAAIQKKANPEVNVGVVERFYASASVKPAFVLGKLASLSQYHLAKIEESGLAVHYQRMLNDISCKIELPFPSVLTTEEQSEFALGYYQQCAEIFKPKEKTNPNTKTTEE